MGATFDHKAMHVDMAQSEIVFFMIYLDFCDSFTLKVFQSDLVHLTTYNIFFSVQI